MKQVLKIVAIFAVCAAIAGASPQIAKAIVHRVEDINITVTIICALDVLISLVVAFMVLDRNQPSGYYSRR